MTDPLVTWPPGLSRDSLGGKLLITHGTPAAAILYATRRLGLARRLLAERYRQAIADLRAVQCKTCGQLRGSYSCRNTCGTPVEEYTTESREAPDEQARG